MDDLFENIESLPKNIQEIISQITESQFSYQDCKKHVELLEQNGYTCEYDLSGELYNLRKL